MKNTSNQVSENENKQVTAIESALTCKCPKCRTGAMFASGNATFISPKINPECSECGFKFEVEPGYFYLARFINYVVTLAELFLFCIAIYFVTNTTQIGVYLFATIANILLLRSFNFRLSRVLLLYLMTPGITVSDTPYKTPGTKGSDEKEVRIENYPQSVVTSLMLNWNDQESL